MRLMTSPHEAMAVNVKDGDTARSDGEYANTSYKDLEHLNMQIHNNPELCFEEVKAHDNITAFLKANDIPVVRHAFGLETSFLEEYGAGGRLVTFCAEYDALPGIGHGCGHNLIAVSSIAAFFRCVASLRQSPIQGRVRLLGCPAEEGGAGKVKLIKAGAFAGVDAALMIHPTPALADLPPGSAGLSYGTCLVTSAFEAVFTGKASHGSAAPWAGINALDAVAIAYVSVGLFRQHMKPTDRIQINGDHGDSALNVIPETGIVRCCVRAETAARRDALKQHVENCIQGAATASGCSLSITQRAEPYADIRPNESLCAEFSRVMGRSSLEFLCDLNKRHLCSFGTDMGNVSYEVPSFHGTFNIPTAAGVELHTREFAEAAGAPEAYELSINVGKGMAATGMRVLQDATFAKQMWIDFQRDKDTM